MTKSKQPPPLLAALLRDPDQRYQGVTVADQNAAVALVAETKARGDRHAGGLMDTPMPTGKTLGESNRSELLVIGEWIKRVGIAWVQ
jgi:hypothetical protein